MKRDAHEDRRVREHPRHLVPVPEAIAIVIVAAVVDEEGILTIDPEPPARVLRRHRAGFHAVTGQTGAAVAAKRLLVEQTAPFEEVANSGRRPSIWPCVRSLL
jgi:hypothetical protein